MKPFISYCLTTYNQKKFVADAVRSALGQTYPNMGIVISDDASTVAEDQGSLALSFRYMNHTDQCR